MVRGSELKEGYHNFYGKDSVSLEKALEILDLAVQEAQKHFTVECISGAWRECDAERDSYIAGQTVMLRKK